MPDPASPDGALLYYGRRLTYFPPSVHQARSQCTMTAALMGANIAFAGTLPATTSEAVKLSKDSGVPELPPDGYTTDHMVTALRRRYGLDLRIEAVGLEAWRDRLSRYGACIIAVRYPDLPEPFRRLAPGFLGGHRMLIVGYDPDEDTTRLLDPLRPGGRDRGQDIKLRKIFDAQGDFRYRQVWVREGQAVDVDAVFDRRWSQPRSVTLEGGGRTYRFWDRRRPGIPVEKRPDADLELEVDARARLTPSIPGLMPSGGPFLRVTGGDRARLAGTWLEVTDGVRLQPRPDEDDDDDAGGVGRLTPATAPKVKRTAFERGREAGRAEERERWMGWLAAMPDLQDGLEGDAPPEAAVGSGLKAIDDPD